VAERLGVDFGTTVEQRLEAAARAGAFKTSMLQDLEAGRRLEIDAILGAVADAARALKVDVPAIRFVLGLLTQKAESLGLR
jgi:2-dehydropantoate 2-reductase